MDNKKLGFVIVVLSILIGFVVFNLTLQLGVTRMDVGCLPSPECRTIQSVMDWSHMAIGALASLLSLGMYLIFFYKGEKAILDRLEKDKDRKLNDEKFNVLLLAFDKNQKKVLNEIRNQPGITQHTLTLRADLSKAKVSQILYDLEQKSLIVREPKGKTYAIYLKNGF